MNLIYHDLERKNERNYGNKGLCQQKDTNGKGKIEIEYYSDEEWKDCLR